MIFGIKTKKDKKIEELEKELTFLKAQPTPTVIYTRYSTKSFVASIRFHKDEYDNIPTEFVKNRLAERMACILRDYMEYTETDDLRLFEKIVEGRITIVIDNS